MYNVETDHKVGKISLSHFQVSCCGKHFYLIKGMLNDAVAKWF